jgi:hypothetical protein
MSESVSRCPNCGATLAPSRFARNTVCEYCQSVVQLDEAAVSAERFRAAHRQWRAADVSDPRAQLTIGGERWRIGPLIAHGEIADVHYAERVRTPTERALVKILRLADDRPMLAAEWAAFGVLRASDARGAEALLPRTPAPIAHGPITEGGHAGSYATLLRYAPRFDHTFETVRDVYPAGVDARIGVWMWRRILEVLSFLHRSGVVHGAVLPQHLLVERGEHGVRLVGFGCAGPSGAPLAAINLRHTGLYPPRQVAVPVLSEVHDLAQAARSVAYALGADDDGVLPRSVPQPLRELLADVADEAEVRPARKAGDAWALRERVGAVARDLFGAPSFHPLALPSGRTTPASQ